MPIEIRELVIKATVHKVVKHEGSGRINKKDLEKIKKEILALCKEEIIELIENREHR
ncbi:MAG: DUF5908 family protein [Bacteroidota bacterium]